MIVLGAEADLKEGTKFTRILRKAKRLKKTADGAIDDSPEAVADLTRSLWKPFWEEGKKIVQVLENFDFEEKG